MTLVERIDNFIGKGLDDSLFLPGSEQFKLQEKWMKWRHELVAKLTRESRLIFGPGPEYQKGWTLDDDHNFSRGSFIAFGWQSGPHAQPVTPLEILSFLSNSTVTRIEAKNLFRRIRENGIKGNV